MDSYNFLNLKISDLKVERPDVYGAAAELKFKINATLHPERYVGGVNGGYGSPALGDGLDLGNISFSGREITVREILNRIVLHNRNTLWLVNLVPERMMEQEPFFAQFDEKQSEVFWADHSVRTA